jgi:lysophospholipase L1-like esterase
MRRAFLIAVMGVASLWAQGTTERVPVRLILVGDSTVAPVNGWGPGFCAIVVPEVACVNLAKNGRSTTSYRAEGLWAEVMEALKQNSRLSATYVLIQFGHNDQPGKPRPADLATDFPRNMREYAREVKSAGAFPVLITPLTRRNFENGKLKNDLDAWAAATRKAAAEERVPVLDLNTESAAAVQKMGPAEADTLAMETPAAFDHTHLGEKGSALFGRMVAGELAAAVPALRLYIRK